MGVFGTIFMIIIILLVVYIVTSCVRIVPHRHMLLRDLVHIMEHGLLVCILRYRLLTALQRKFY